jgi:hypothetical protein
VSRLQVTLKKTSELVGKGIREAGFRGRFCAAVIAGWLGEGGFRVGGVRFQGGLCMLQR